jgi:hypothetical protein
MGVMLFLFKIKYSMIENEMPVAKGCSEGPIEGRRA